MFGCVPGSMACFASVASTPIASTPIASTPIAATTFAGTAVAGTAIGRRPLLVMTRVLDVPRDDAFAEWSSADRLARWWQMRADGRRRPDIDRFVVTIIEVRAPERIVFAWGGHRADTTSLITITLTDEGAGTRWTLEQSL